MFHPVFRVYKITINVLEQPSHELSIQASVNSKKEGRGGETFENNRYELMRNRRHQTARELKDVNCNVIATFCMSLQSYGDDRSPGNTAKFTTVDLIKLSVNYSDLAWIITITQVIRKTSKFQICFLCVVDGH